MFASVAVALLYVASTTIPSHAFITRTPHCRYSANFSRIERNQFVQDTGSGLIIKHVNKNSSQCALLCVTTPSCFHINHKRDNTTCHLITSRIVTQLPTQGWDVLETNYTLWHQRPLCQYLNATPNFNSICVKRLDEKSCRLKILP